MFYERRSVSFTTLKVWKFRSLRKRLSVLKHTGAVENAGKMHANTNENELI